MRGGPHRAWLPDGRRLHFQHGPIDLILEAFGAEAEVRRAYAQAWAAFRETLPALVAELAVLRRPVAAPRRLVHGAVARRMMAAVWPHRRVFVTPMAAVAGAVADHVLAAMAAERRLPRAYVNNGGDIALYLTPGERFEAGVVTRVDAPALDGVAEVTHGMPVRGIATSGRGGRSFSLGIAESVTVLAPSAAAADAAATLIASATDLDHPGIERVPAEDLDPDSDLRGRSVTRSVPALARADVAAALAAGREAADGMAHAGLIHSAMLSLQGRCVVAGAAAPALAGTDPAPSRREDGLR